MTPQNEIDQVLEKYNLTIGYELSFPRYRIIPDEVRLALSVLKTHGMKITISLQGVSKGNKR